MKPIRVITLDLDDTLWDIAPVIELAEKRLWAWFEENYSLIPKFFSPDKIFILRSKIVKEFPDKSKRVKFVRFHISDGISPVSWLLCKYKVYKFVSPISTGISPVSWL